MPLPLLFIGLGAATAATGIGTTIKAGIDNSHAKELNRRSQNKIEQESWPLERARKKCGKALEHLGKEKIFIASNSIKEFMDSFEKIKNIELSSSAELNERIHIDIASLHDLRKMESIASSLAGGVATGAASGALVAFGAYNAAATFASASTGTAIASLSGAVAHNATLAFFGGGSLAVGGLGMAGGTVVLGGLVAGPALLVMGMITGAKASKNLDNAYANAAEAETICEQLYMARIQSNAIRERAYMFYILLARLDTYFVPLIHQMETVIDTEGTDYSRFSPDGKHTVSAAASIAATIKAVLDTPILTEDGSLTAESESTIADVLIVLDNKETAITF